MFQAHDSRHANLKDVPDDILSHIFSYLRQTFHNRTDFDLTPFDKQRLSNQVGPARLVCHRWNVLIEKSCLLWTYFEFSISIRDDAFSWDSDALPTWIERSQRAPLQVVIFRIDRGTIEDVPPSAILLLREQLAPLMATIDRWQTLGQLFKAKQPQTVFDLFSSDGDAFDFPKLTDLTIKHGHIEELRYRATLLTRLTVVNGLFSVKYISRLERDFPNLAQLFLQDLCWESRESLPSIHLPKLTFFHIKSMRPEHYTPCLFQGLEWIVAASPKLSVLSLDLSAQCFNNTFNSIKSANLVIKELDLRCRSYNRQFNHLDVVILTKWIGHIQGLEVLKLYANDYDGHQEENRPHDVSDLIYMLPKLPFRRLALERVKARAVYLCSILKSPSPGGDRLLTLCSHTELFFREYWKTVPPVTDIDYNGFCNLLDQYFN